MNKQQQIDNLKEQIMSLMEVVEYIKKSIGYEPLSGWCTVRRHCKIDRIEEYLGIRWSEEITKGYKKIKK